MLDLNNIRAGAVTLTEINASCLDSSSVNAALLSSSAVAAWNNRAVNNCPYLWGNWFDYRLSSSTDGLDHADIEPLEKVTLTLNSNDRWHTGLAGEHYRVVQGQHFNNIPRKGIYCYSFALNGSSPFPQGTVNFSRIDTVNMTFDINSDYPGPNSSNTAGHGTGLELLLYAEHFNIWKVGKNSVGKTFG